MRSAVRLVCTLEVLGREEGNTQHQMQAPDHVVRRNSLEQWAERSPMGVPVRRPHPLEDCIAYTSGSDT